MKDHYHTLGLPPTAGLPAIRRAHRRLVLKYHPDKAPDNPFAEARFLAIQEAYQVLSDAGRRAAYDEERWLRGHSSQRSPRAVTPAWIAGEAQRLLEQLRRSDTYRLDFGALRACILYLLSDAHLAVLREEAHPADTSSIVQSLLGAASFLPMPYLQEPLERLRLAADGDAALLQATGLLARKKTREQQQRRLLPWLVLVLAVLLCLAMAFWGRR